MNEFLRFLVVLPLFIAAAVVFDRLVVLFLIP
jgi:hypothetical protein